MCKKKTVHVCVIIIVYFSISMIVRRAGTSVETCVCVCVCVCARARVWVCVCMWGWVSVYVQVFVLLFGIDVLDSSNIAMHKKKKKNHHLSLRNFR